MVVVVDRLLEMLGKVRIPPALPPIYPTDLPPEHPEQDRTFAPPDRVLLEASPSGVVSLGPVLQVPACTLMTQFTSFVYFLLMYISPHIVYGHTYQFCRCPRQSEG